MVDLVLDVRSITRSYGAVTALRELSFEARSGEIIGLLGPNGAGKTTAIRVLTTILPPSQGSFSLAGTPHTKAAAIRQRIGVLPESAGYPQNQTGEEFIRYHGCLFGLSGTRARDVARELLAEVDLKERAAGLIGTYSRGMRQRLGVARALVNEPDVIFLDEPTLGLDPAGQRQMLELIRDVAQQRGATVLLSTHFLDEVEEVCSRAIILNHGAVVAQGTIDEIKRRAAPGTARVQVSPEQQKRAATALRGAQGIKVEAARDPGWFILTLDGGGLEQRGNTIARTALVALIEADVPILSFELEGSRLSDAFFALTGEATQ